MSLIELEKVKISCANKFSLIDKILTKCWPFITYGKEAFSSPKSREIKNWLKDYLPVLSDSRNK